ncbi:hypothetical protein [Pseudoalteromonas luteoviolacea]|uniref:Uncharacterized protein n=1 Tax=Pseudoalteromonas luteoviolacea DSM 6061 TaxID=1365250 RepID=A0A166VLA9_9GAMM|nr:hypothetical protein [Pseudoalteromonas luteoviolacea]KZN32992.1 hypothetical protein N475_20950 [Pseudoalteromonas luteoviolacea DSM 6061]KZN55665.1 hypothetical protein N474_14050 [Pseudoalteromonas luteoviolacea CPMOR-2]MBE0385290.1 hypothetical protein [Pseudoalteromonas luteoviolacea DSM 6061]TQF69911.1 DUF342 domain-containing protein [Pseudoalteromonas luteoviolacea]
MPDEWAAVNESLQRLKTLCNEQKLEEALKLVKELDNSLRAQLQLSGWQQDEHLRTIVIDAYETLSQLSEKLTTKKKEVASELKNSISNKKKINAYKSL